MYGVLGLTAGQTQVYEHLVERQIRNPHQVAEELALEPDAVLEAMQRLDELGLVAQDPEDSSLFSVIPPDLSLEALIRRKEGELQRMRLYTEGLADRYRIAARRDRSDEIVEVIRGSREIGTCVDQLVCQARNRLEVLSRPPYLNGFSPGREELKALEGGLPARVIYAKEALEQDSAAETLRTLGAVGEQTRILPEVPVKLLMADRRLALVPLATEEGAAVVVVRPSGLLDALVVLFDTLWEKAVPYGGHGSELLPAQFNEDERQLVQILAAGLKDETAARHLGLGVRTIRRRIAAVMEQLDATTRFQAGYLLGLRAAATPQQDSP
ncbi:helix-turn-helix domain-containing protein [Streptomyces sp. NPDC057909]|uniref:helix-turn-helix domain-containing protein n=1 Tax=Streptomyces sp. NPDC057909 TaxID=3346277 RepID=UPI0036EBD4C1